MGLLFQLDLSGLERFHLKHRVDGRAASTRRFQASLDVLHLLDFPALRADDLLAQTQEFRVLQFCLPAHENCAGVMRDHRVDELPIIDQDLRACSGKRSDRQGDKHGVK